MVCLGLATGRTSRKNSSDDTELFGHHSRNDSCVCRGVRIIHHTAPRLVTDIETLRHQWSASEAILRGINKLLLGLYVFLLSRQASAVSAACRRFMSPVSVKNTIDRHTYGYESNQRSSCPETCGESHLTTVPRTVRAILVDRVVGWDRSHAAYDVSRTSRLKRLGQLRILQVGGVAY